jgi:hypothetical protein
MPLLLSSKIGWRTKLGGLHCERNCLNQPDYDALYLLDVRLLTEKYLYNSIYNCIYIVKLENAQNEEVSEVGIKTWEGMRLNGGVQPMHRDML